MITWLERKVSHVLRQEFSQSSAGDRELHWSPCFLFSCCGASYDPVPAEQRVNECWGIGNIYSVEAVLLESTGVYSPILAAGGATFAVVGKM